jgi:DNA repair protein SbcC/Rad50
MTDIRLQELEVTNFRSIKGAVHAPLDAKVVLIHGENGSGKTSLLAAIELALTGLVASLHRADPSYSAQLLRRSADGGQIELRTVGLPDNNYFKTLLTKTGTEQREKLPLGLASFFSERSWANYCRSTRIQTPLRIHHYRGS